MCTFAKSKQLFMALHNDLGKWGEEMAAEYLERKGFRIIERDWRIGHRDIDIIAIDCDTLVIVEVRTRRNNVFIEPELTIDKKKIRSLMLAANTYVKTHYLDADQSVRFDIVTVLGANGSDCKINHIENAFVPILC